MPTSLYGPFFRTVLYPVFNRLIGRDLFRALAERARTESLSAERVRSLQWAKLQQILRNAADRVPFYRDRFRELGIDPRDMRGLDDFTRLGLFVAKEDVRAQTERFIAEGADRGKLTWHRSGGSTGDPLTFATDPPTGAASAAGLFRAVGWWGVDMGARHAMFWGSPRFIVRKPIDRWKQKTLSVRHYLMNRKFFSNYDLNPENMRCYREVLERFRPVYVRGMASSLFLFARFVLSEGLRLDRGRPRIVFSACEQLYPWERETIAEGFGAPVADTYGVSELGEVAFEAPCGRLHTMDEDVLIELVPTGDGRKEIVLTQLNNMLSPLIRYRTGDVAEGWEVGCECGRGLGYLEGLQGRAHDFIVTADGRFVHGQFFTHLLVYEKGIQKYQVIQETVDRFRVLIEREPGFDVAAEARVRSGARGYLGDGVAIEFEYPEAIPLTAAGKHRWIISKVGRRDVREASA